MGVNNHVPVSTWREVVQAVAAECGYHHITDAVADHTLWSETAWPLCGRTEVLRQLREFFTRERAMTPREHAIRIVRASRG